MHIHLPELYGKSLRNRELTMDITASIFLFGAAVSGVFLLNFLMGGTERPQLLVTTHVFLTIMGILSLLIYSFTTEAMEKHYHTLVLLAIAGGAGIWLLWLSGRSVHLQKAAAITYCILGMVAWLWLLTFIITN